VVDAALMLSGADGTTICLEMRRVSAHREAIVIPLQPRTIICAVFAPWINEQLFVASGERFLNSLLGVVGVCWAH